MIAGAYGYEVPPVPIPNTEVKLIHAEDTQMVTSRENRAAPAFSVYSSIAQSVERMTVNHDVVSSSLTGAAIKNPEAIASGFFLFYGSITNVGIGSNPIPTFVIEPVCVRATKIPGCDRLPWKTDVLHCRQR